MSEQIQAGTAIDPEAIRHAADVLEDATAVGHDPSNVVFYDQQAMHEGDDAPGSELFSLVYTAEDRGPTEHETAADCTCGPNDGCEFCAGQ